MKRSALLIIDMQNDFCKPKAPLFVPSNPKIIPKIKEEIENARKTGIKIVFTQDWHKPDDKEFEIWPRHCVEGTKGAEIVEKLTPTKADLVVKKSSYSAFYKTGLEKKLRRLGIDTLIITGCVTNICVLFTAFDAFLRGFKITVKRDCLGYVDKKYHDFALKLMEKAFGVEIE